MTKVPQSEKDRLEKFIIDSGEPLIISPAKAVGRSRTADSDPTLFHMKLLRGFDAERLSTILGDLFSETLLPEGVSTAEMVIDQIIWCAMDKQDEATELARTKHPFIAKAIVEGGRAKNRFVIVVNPVR